MACGIFSFSVWGPEAWPGIKPGPPALEVQSLRHWTTREVPHLMIKFFHLHGWAAGGDALQNEVWWYSSYSLDSVRGQVCLAVHAPSLAEGSELAKKNSYVGMAAISHRNSSLYTSNQTKQTSLQDNVWLVMFPSHDRLCSWDWKVPNLIWVLKT